MVTAMADTETTTLTPEPSSALSTLTAAEMLTLPIPTEILFARFERLRMLREQKLKIEQEIRILAGDEALWERVPVHCKRCDWDWIPFSPFMPPITCARCGTTSWNRAPTKYSRKPGDPPAKSWRNRKGGRAPKHGDSVMRYRAREIHRKRPQNVNATPPVPPAPWEIAPLHLQPTAVTIPPPPSTGVVAIIPPPPTFALHADEYEPQPERTASHATPPPSPILMEEESLKKTAENINVVEVEVEQLQPTLERLEEITPPADVPPETIGQPRTDAEREELARAKEDVWPTTRSDD